jgi:hypothetical protein
MVGHLRSCTCLALFWLAAGCGPPPMPGVLVGESAHFRLFVDPNFDLAPPAAYMQGAEGLAALETDWADKRTMLGMPEGRKIDYHLLGVDHIASSCEGRSEVGCEAFGYLEIAAPYLPYQHELMHAYMELLAPGGLPIPLLAEGAAQSIGCDTEAETDLTYIVPWQQAVTETSADTFEDIYGEGGVLARYLIRTKGVEAFIRYYRQAPQRRDPALFAENFFDFWNMSIDDVWAAMHVVPAGAATTDESICPCSLPALPIDGEPIANDLDTNPYWTLPNAPGGSVGLTAGSRPKGPSPSSSSDDGKLIFQDCLGTAPLFGGSSAAVIQLPSDGRQRYLQSPIASSTVVADYLSETCAGTVPFQLPAGFWDAGQSVLQTIARQTTAAALAMYLQIQVPSATQVSTYGPADEICDSCAFDQGPCQPLPSTTGGTTAGTTGAALGPISPVAPGPLYLKLTFPSLGPGGFLPAEVSDWITFLN